jgi:hypothetical protein
MLLFQRRADYVVQFRCKVNSTATMQTFNSFNALASANGAPAHTLSPLSIFNATYTDSTDNPPQPKDEQAIQKLKAHINYLELDHVDYKRDANERLNKLREQKYETRIQAYEAATRQHKYTDAQQHTEASEMFDDVTDAAKIVLKLDKQLNTIHKDFYNRTHENKATYTQLKEALHDYGVLTQSDVSWFDE